MRTSSAVLTAALVYVVAWLVGLITAPARPTAGGAAATRDYFLEHAGAAMVQSLLVHGVAGLALAGFALGLNRLLSSVADMAVTPRAILILGLGAALLSLVQVGLLLSVATQTSSLVDEVIARRVQWIDHVDVAKLFLLGAFAVVVSRAGTDARILGFWVVPLAIVLAVLLVLGGISFLVANNLLTAALYVSLPLLLVWVGTVGVSVHRNAPPDTTSEVGSRW